MTFNWTDENQHQLRTLWAEGHSFTILGDKIGCGKNAAVGKAHRLGLSRPLNFDPDVMTERRKLAADLRARGKTVREIGRLLNITRRQAEGAIKPAVSIIVPLPSMAVKPIPIPVPIFTPPPPERVAIVNPTPQPKPVSKATCAYPLNDGVLPDGRRGWLWCSEKALFGKTYCAEHQKFCWSKVKNRREDDVT